MPTVSAGPETFTFPRAGDHRSDDQLDERYVGRDSAHYLRGHGLVATSDEHGPVNRMARERLLDLYRQQVSIQHRRGVNHDFRKRHRREHHRQATGFEDAAFYRVDELRHLSMARCEVRDTVPDTDDWSSEIVLVVSCGGEEDLSQIATETFVRITRQP